MSASNEWATLSAHWRGCVPPQRILLSCLKVLPSVTLPLEINVDWLDFFEDVREHVRDGDWGWPPAGIAEAVPSFGWMARLGWLLAPQLLVLLLEMDSESLFLFWPPGKIQNSSLQMYSLTDDSKGLPYFKSSNTSEVLWKKVDCKTYPNYAVFLLDPVTFLRGHGEWRKGGC